MKNTKKFAGILICVILLLSSALFAVSCSKNDHTHTYSSTWTSDESGHWHAATCEHETEKADFTAHTYGAYEVVKEASETEEGREERTCTVCGYKDGRAIGKLSHTHTYASEWTADESGHWHAATCEHETEKADFEAHNFDQESATDPYLKEETSMEYIYYKSCVCGYKSSETFAVSKSAATLTNIQMSGKVYDGNVVDPPTFSTNSTGEVTIEYKEKGANDDTYSIVAPKNVGQYVVRIRIAQTNEYAPVSGTAEFEITAKEVELVWSAPANLQYDGNAKIPTVKATLLNGDECSVEIEINEGDNVMFDESFTFKAISLGNSNYKLPQDVISPSYTITMNQAQPDVATEVWLDKDEVSYFKIHLTEGTHYVFEFSPGNQGSVFNFKLYKKGDTTLIAEREVEWTSAVDCTIDKTAILIETTGDYYVKVTGILSASDGEVTIATDNHSNLDEHGFCVVCGQYKGTEIAFDQNITLSLKKGEKAFYRFAYPGDNLKWKRSFKSPLASGDFTFYTTGNNSTWETITVTNSFEEQITPFDGYYYIVITADTSFNNGQFSIDSNTDAYGFWGTEYVGETISVGKTQNISGLESGQKKYLRFAVNGGFGYGFNRTDNLGVNEIKFYIRQSGTWNEQTLNGACNTLDYTPDDGYCYVVITSDGDSTGTLTILHEFKGQTLAAGSNEVTIKAGKVEYFRFAVEEGRNYCFVENISSGGASATVNAYYLLNGVYTNLTVDTTNTDMLGFWHKITGAIADYSDGYVYLRVYANTDVNGTLSYAEINNA